MTTQTSADKIIYLVYVLNSVFINAQLIQILITQIIAKFCDKTLT